jgi:hypothetical protein
MEVAALRQRIAVLELRLLSWEAFGEELLSAAREADASVQEPGIIGSFLRVLGERVAALRTR